jgi:hypothetical protein
MRAGAGRRLTGNQFCRRPRLGEESRRPRLGPYKSGLHFCTADDQAGSNGLRVRPDCGSAKRTPSTAIEPRRFNRAGRMGRAAALVSPTGPGCLSKQARHAASVYASESGAGSGPWTAAASGSA